LSAKFLVVHQREQFRGVLRDRETVVPAPVAYGDLHRSTAIALHRLVEVESTTDVDLDTLARRGLHLRGPENAGKMNDTVMQAHGVGERFAVADVAEVESDADRDVGEAAIEDRHTVAAFAKHVDDVASDEALAASDEHLHRLDGDRWARPFDHPRE